MLWKVAINTFDFLKNNSMLIPEQLSRKEIFLVYGDLRTGGIETLIVRLANLFSSAGISVSICCNPGGELESLLSSNVKIIGYNNINSLVRQVRGYKKISPLPSETLIMSFDPISAARALMLDIVLSRDGFHVKHVSGVFHPRAYFMAGERKDRVFLNRLVFHAVGDACMFFMNAECRKTHAVAWGERLDSCPIIPLPVNMVEPIWRPLSRDEIKVISIGRLVDFKAYNLGAPRIVKECLLRGVSISWDIFGDGPLREAIKAEIKMHGVEKNIRLMGLLDYKEFSKIAVQYDLFVGMGTAALEAAMLGIPTICSTVDEQECCYGYLSDLPFGNVGERLDTSSKINIADLIFDFFNSSDGQKKILSRQDHLASAKYGASSFFDAIAKLEFSSNPSSTRFFRRLVAWLYFFLTEGILAKLARILLSKNSPCSRGES